MNILVLALIAVCTLPALAQSQKDLVTSASWSIHRGKKEIVITIDDGPTVGVTDRMLDILKKYNVQASFFVVGNRIAKNRFLLDRMAQEGHIVANHTVTHPNFASISAFSARREILKAHELIAPYITNTQYLYFRAPGGNWRPNYARAFNRFNSLADEFKGPVNWDIGGSVNFERNGEIKEAADWACWSKKMSVKTCLDGYIKETLSKKGGIVLFHDLRSMSSELLEGYLEYFSQHDDYRFVSLDEVDL